MKLFVGIRNLAQIRSQDEKIVSGSAMNILPNINNAWLSVKNGQIEDFGPVSG